MKRILLVDDKPENLDYLETLLVGHGYEVETSPHGADALERARAHLPDLVVSDLLMPVMDGYTLLRHWKADVEFSKIPFVVFTATYTEPEDERLARTLGADSFILKPIEPEAFLARIREVETSALRDEPRRPVSSGDRSEMLGTYSRSLVRKLEEKTLELARANQALRKEVEERRRAIEELERERARLAEAQAVTGMGNWEVDLVTDEVEWSDQVWRNLGLEPEPHGPTRGLYHACVHPDDRARVDRAVEASILEGPGRDYTLAHRIVTPQGEVRHLEQRWRVVPGDDGAIERLTGTCSDVTAQTEAEATLRESEERFRQLAETIREVFWITDPAKTRMLYLSPAYEEIWGRPREELYADPERWLDSVHEDDLGEATGDIVPAQRTGAYDRTYRIVRPDGTERWIHDRAFPVLDDEGEVRRIVGIAEDITERKEIEAQFLRAQRMESIGTLASGVAHDLNNVLTPILLAIDFLRHDEDPAERGTSIDMIETCALKGADMLRQLLSFARGIDGPRSVVDVRDLVNDVHRIVTDTFLKAVHVECEAPTGLPRVTGDATQLHQVLLNLCVNARDAMPGGGTLTLRVGRERVGRTRVAHLQDIDPGDYVVISVGDTGSGMDPKVLDRIFEPFYSTKPPDEGTGLGLPTSLAIVRSHGGFVDVESEPGVGTTFTLYLPAVGEGTDAREGGLSEVPLLRGRGELILVADDEATIREITRRTLEAWGYRVLLADDGEEAVARFRERGEEIDAVVCDMMMPVRNGPSAIREMHQLRPGIPLIAVSGLVGSSDALWGGETPPVVGHLMKPYVARDLLEVLADALGHREEGAEGAEPRDAPGEVGPDRR
ncbi:MAG: response regulator [Longimicrobiales bacterium]|nr:response regulator [Longimicrobiales bacterium]